MIFIIGGSYQGKTDCALKRLRGQENQKMAEAEGSPPVFDARNMKTSEKLDTLFQEISDSQAVLHLELLIKRLMEQDLDTAGWEQELFSALQDRENAEKIITADEIGYGIVPLDPFERAYREKEGRFCQRVAARAREVWRIVCGMETQIK